MTTPDLAGDVTVGSESASASSTEAKPAGPEVSLPPLGTTPPVAAAATAPVEADPAGDVAEDVPTVDPAPEPASTAPVVESLETLTAVREVGEQVSAVSTALAELSRLRTRDIELADKMHGEITKLRAGEIRSAMTPLLKQLIRLVDQMDKLDATPGSDVQALREQLVQIVDTTAGVTVYVPVPGDEFDAKTQMGTERRDSPVEGLDGRVAACVRPGFRWDDGVVIRAAEVAVHRYVPGPEPVADGVAGESEGSAPATADPGSDGAAV